MQSKPKKLNQTLMSPDELFGYVVEALHNHSRITESKMFGSRGLKVDGKVFAFLYKGKLVVKLPQERVKAMVAYGDGEFFDPGHGRIMKEWVAVKPPGKDQWITLAEDARSFVASKR